MNGPEHIEGGAPRALATRWERFGAWIGDSVLLGVLLFGLGMAAGAAPDALALALGILALATWLLYEPVSMALLRGATPAKRGVDAYVARADGRPAGFWLGFFRSLVKLVLSFLIVVDGLFVLLRRDRRALHDLICGTTVYDRAPAAGRVGSFSSPATG